MDLIVWRHADAFVALEGESDHDRKLTPKGLKQAERMSKWLQEKLPKHARIYVSPAIRAQQTAKALTDKFETLPALNTDQTPDAGLVAVGWPKAPGTVVIVGHQPILGGIITQLVFGKATPFTIKKGAIAWLSHDQVKNKTRLLGLLTTDLI